MTRESLQTKLEQQQQHLNRIRQSFHPDQSHPMLSRAEEIQQLLNDMNADLCHSPNAASYGSINEAISSYIKSQLDGLNQGMLVRNE